MYILLIPVYGLGTKPRLKKTNLDISIPKTTGEFQCLIWEKRRFSNSPGRYFPHNGVRAKIPNEIKLKLKDILNSFLPYPSLAALTEKMEKGEIESDTDITSNPQTNENNHQNTSHPPSINDIYKHPLFSTVYYVILYYIILHSILLYKYNRINWIKQMN